MDETERQMVAISQRQREEQAAIPPDQMFRSQTDKYSAFNEKGKLSTARKTREWHHFPLQASQLMTRLENLSVINK